MKKLMTLILIFCMIGILFINYELEVNSHINHDKTPNHQTNINNTTVKYEDSGYCNNVVDGDTLDVNGVGRIRLVGVNAPEVGEPGYQKAKDFVKSKCLGRVVGLDIDDSKPYDKYGRILAVVYIQNTNINDELLKRGYAEITFHLRNLILFYGKKFLLQLINIYKYSNFATKILYKKSFDNYLVFY